MNRFLFAVAIAATVALAVLAADSGFGVGRPHASRLDGAAAAVEAVEFPTLQAAIDALPDEGGIVRLPAGTFEIDEPLVIRGDDVCLEGAGTATHIKNTNTARQPAILLAHYEHKGDANDREHELWRVRLAHFRLTGNENSGAGIVARNVNEIHLDGITVSEHGGDGVLLSYCYEDPRVCQSLFTYNKGTGLNLRGCHDIVVSANQFEENQDALHCTDGFNLCMTGNCLDDHLGHGVVIENTYGSVVSGNMIEECAGTAIVVDRDCYGIAFCANVIAHDGAGIDLRDAHGCSVSANTFTIMKTAALRIGPKSGRITVGGNCFSSSYIGEGTDKRVADDRTAAGLVIEKAHGVLVDGNLFSGIDAPAIAGASSGESQSMLSHNLFIETEPGVPAEEIKQLVSEGNYAD
ncbi:MAG: right-handed parallel beta-helix repeat-containing protein [Planctomycetota bacterium]|nr:MAG: right-handed parallel beta-helix repeat-containing protein [Planctomycetota bacterium]